MAELQRSWFQAAERLPEKMSRPGRNSAAAESYPSTSRSKGRSQHGGRLNATSHYFREYITKAAGLTAAFVLISGLFIHAARADIYWETETTMTNVRHNSNGSSIQKYYLTETASRLELGDKKVLILNHNSMMLYALDPKKQKFSVLDLNSLPGFPARLVAALVGLRATRTGELKTISGYRCHGWNVHLAILNGECWFSDEVEGFGEYRILGEGAAAAVERSPLFNRIDITGTFNRIAGFPVWAVYHVLGGTVAIKLIKVEQKSLDPYLFVVPKGYSPGKVSIAGYNGPAAGRFTPWLFTSPIISSSGACGLRRT